MGGGVMFRFESGLSNRSCEMWSRYSFGKGSREWTKVSFLLQSYARKAQKIMAVFVGNSSKIERPSTRKPSHTKIFTEKQTDSSSSQNFSDWPSDQSARANLCREKLATRKPCRATIFTEKQTDSSAFQNCSDKCFLRQARQTKLLGQMLSEKKSPPANPATPRFSQNHRLILLLSKTA